MIDVVTQATALIEGVDPEQVFDYATDRNAATEFFTGFGPIPAIKSVAMLDSAEPEVGARREVVLADGSTLEEEILQFDRPQRHTYRVGRFSPPLSWLTRTARGEWTFTATGDGTLLTWRYAYTLTTPVVYPVAALFVKFFMRRAMQRAVDRIAARSW